MQSQGKIWVALAVILLGCTAAWLFRRTEGPNSSPAEKPGDELVLREKDGSVSNAPPTAGAASYLLGKVDSVLPVTTSYRPSAGQNATTPATSAARERAAPQVPKPRLSAKPPWGSTNLGQNPRRTSDAPRQPREQNNSAATPRAALRPKRRTHKIVDGDTLSLIAARYLGTADRYLEIFEANRQLLPSPDILPIGVELNIPPKSHVITTPKTRRVPKERSLVNAKAQPSPRLLNNAPNTPAPSRNVGHAKPKASKAQPPAKPLVPVPPVRAPAAKRPT